MSDVQLITGGRVHAGWKSLRVQRGMDQCSGSFELGVSELWGGRDSTRSIAPGETCRLLVDGESVVTGYVDEVTIDYSASAHQVDVRGRDKTADLVDCSAIRGTGQWQGVKLEAIAQQLAAPFGIRVTAAVDTGKAFPNFALQEGETVFEAIERMARIRALLLQTDGAGNLVITRAGLNRVSTALRLGENILQARAGLNLRDRFSQYVFKGQAAGGDFFSGTTVSQIKAVATDPGVSRYRPLVVVAEAQDVAASLTQRAQWEANVRAARSTEVSITVQGWHHADGLWQPNTIVAVRHAALRLDDELLIKSVTFTLDDNGTTTQLSLTRADAFTLLPLLESAGTAEPFWGLPKPAVEGK